MTSISIGQTTWVLLSATTVSLLGLNIYLSRWDVDISPANIGPVNTVASDTTTTTGQIGNRDGLQLLQTLSRPLFNPTRREYVAEAKHAENDRETPRARPQSQNSVKLPAIAFQGTRMIDQKYHALIHLDGSQVSEWLEIAGKVGEWTITKITAETLTLTRGSDSISLNLFANERNPTNARNTTNRSAEQ